MESVDETKDALRALLDCKGTIAREALECVGRFSTWMINAAVLELEVDGDIQTWLTSCTSCGEPQFALHRVTGTARVHPSPQEGT